MKKQMSTSTFLSGEATNGGGGWALVPTYYAHLVLERARKHHNESANLAT